MFSALLRDVPPSQFDDTLPLGDTGYRIAREHLLDEVRLIDALNALERNSIAIELPSDFVERRRNGFLQNKRLKMESDDLAEQLQVVFDEFPKHAALTIVTGPPGAAKTTVTSLYINLVTEIFPAMPVILVTRERPALHRLQEKMHLQDPVILTLAESLQDDVIFPEGACLILDEASLCGTHDMAVLLEKAAAANTRRVILIGDDKQLFPSEVGQPFRWLRENNKGLIITVTRSFRQKTQELAHLVESLHKGDIISALDEMNINFTSKDNLVKSLRQILDHKAPEKTLIIVHGEPPLIERLRILCPGFRIYSLGASQGLAIDDIIFVVAEQINLSELLVGCSRQRFALDILVDQAIYADKTAIAGKIGDYPRSLMALDVITEDELRKLVA